MANKLTKRDLEEQVEEVEYLKHTTKHGQILRWAVITTKSGFAVTGKPSAAVSPENDNQVMGREIAYENAFRVMWELEGYSLKKALALNLEM